MVLCLYSLFYAKRCLRFIERGLAFHFGHEWDFFIPMSKGLILFKWDSLIDETLPSSSLAGM